MAQTWWPGNTLLLCARLFCFCTGSFAACQDKSSTYENWVKLSRSCTACTADVNRGRENMALVTCKQFSAKFFFNHCNVQRLQNPSGVRFRRQKTTAPSRGPSLVIHIGTLPRPYLDPSPYESSLPTLGSAIRFGRPYLDLSATLCRIGYALASATTFSLLVVFVPLRFVMAALGN